MDPVSLSYANALLGNPPTAAGLEVTLSGPTLKFHRPAAAAVCGGAVSVTLDGTPAPMWQRFDIPKGSELAVGSLEGGARCYVAVEGGFDAPVYLGSRATFPGGSLGGYQGRPLKARFEFSPSLTFLCLFHNVNCDLTRHVSEIRSAGKPCTGVILPFDSAHCMHHTHCLGLQTASNQRNHHASIHQSKADCRMVTCASWARRHRHRRPLAAPLRCRRRGGRRSMLAQASTRGACACCLGHRLRLTTLRSGTWRYVPAQ